jgi:hypothetical protein
MSGLLPTALLLLSIALLEAALGPRNADLRQFLALVAMLPVFWRLAVTVDRRHRLLGAAGIASAVLVVAWYATGGAAQYLALAGALGVLALAQRPDADDRRSLGAALALTALGYGAFVAVRDHVTLWPVLYPLSANVSQAVASVLRTPARLGPTYSGAWLLASFGIAFAARAAVARRRPTWWGVAAIILLAVLPGGALWLRRAAFAGMRAGLHLQFLMWRPTLFVLMLVPLALFLREQRIGEGGAAATRARRTAAPGAAVRRHAGGLVWIAMALVGLAVLAYAPRVPQRTGGVLLDARGEFSLDPLAWGLYGPDIERGASLATLPPLLRARGFTVTVSDTTITPAALDAHDVLVVMNPSYEFTDEERASIWAFVDAGGGLLVLGDHTNIGETMGPLNALLEPSGVAIEFDSAIPDVRRWTWYDCVRVHPHPVTRGIRDETDVKVSVGASLRLPLRATPLLSGRDAFSDYGNWNNAQGAYLGNMQHDAHETLGDIPLAARVRHGRGKVIVFGDTSTFQRSAIYNTHELVTRVFTYLATPDAGETSAPVRVAGAVLLVVGVAGLLSAGAAGLVGALVAGVLGLVVLLGVGARSGVGLPPLTEETEVAWLDLAHGNRVDLHTGEPDGISGFVDHLWRHDLLPLGMKEFDPDALRDAAVYATVAPARPFTRSERAALREYVEEGGLLIVATGYEERNGAGGLLAEFGYAIGATPIGAAHAALVDLGELRQVAMHESWPVVFGERRADVWVSSWDFPLVTFERVGSGGLLVIGDSFFLCDTKQESNERYVRPNIDFLRAAIETARARIASGGGS